MDFNTKLAGIMPPNQVLEIDPASLCAALAKVTDHRGKKGRLYRACIVLTLLVFAKLAGQTTPAAIARYNRLRQDWLCQALNLKRGRLPCANTYVYVCQQIDLTELKAALSQFFNQLSSSPAPTPPPPRQESDPPGLRHLALDGKAITSTYKSSSNECQPVHILELYEVETGQVLQHLNVGKKENEITVAPRLLQGQNLHNCLISADAIHTQREWCKLVDQQGAKWLLIAKGNQPGLLEDLTLLFADEATWPQWLERRSAETWDKGHGRLEHRRLTLSSEIKEFLAEHWTGVEQVFRLERQVSSPGKERQEVVYGLTSLTHQQAGPAEVLHYVRRHWSIENKLHWRKDVTLKEDACLSRRGQTPQVFAALNNLVLGLMDFLKVSNVPAQMATFVAQPARPLHLLFSNIIL